MILNTYINDFLKKYSNFKIENIGEKINLIGELTLNHESKNKGIAFYKKFNIKIVINFNYPLSLPMVFETNQTLNSNYHINPDKSLCLGTDLDIRLKLYPKYSLIDFVENFIFPFLYSSMYFDRFQESNSKERSHGTTGENESILDFFEINDSKKGSYLISNLLKRKYKRALIFKRNLYNHNCICGNNKKLYQCHKKQLELLIKIYGGNNKNKL